MLPVGKYNTDLGYNDNYWSDKIVFGYKIHPSFKCSKIRHQKVKPSNRLWLANIEYDYENRLIWAICNIPFILNNLNVWKTYKYLRLPISYHYESYIRLWSEL